LKYSLLRPLFPSEARALGISWPYAMGIKANPNAGREFLVTNRILTSRSFDRIDISRRFNLGNHVRQVANAIRFAELQEIPMVGLPSGSVFSRGIVGDITLTHFNGEPSRRRRLLVGDFFYFEKLGISLEGLERGRVIKGLRHLVPSLQGKELIVKLGIHLRAGDTFSLSPHPLYMPPPLQFFLESIERSHAARLGGVHMICQDIDHPYVNPIANFCREREISYDVSSSSLEEDFRSLASFEELCISQGTLALAAAWLSGDCKTIFAFQRDSSEMLTTAETGIRVESATSVSPLGPWLGSESQMAVLSDPSATSLRWESFSARPHEG
jgi:hypothetical protein